MTVTLHLPAAPAARSAMVRRLAELAGSARAIRSGGAGLVVSDDLARAYLNERAPALPPAPVRVVSPELARVVRTAEGRAGLLDTPTSVDSPAPEPPPRTRTAARRPRRTTAQQQGAPES